MGRFDDYSGILTAYPYAAKTTDSWFFRAYVLVSAFVTLFVTLLFATALVELIAATARVPGGAVTLTRTFYVVVLLFIILPMVAPVLFVAYRYRRETSVSTRYDQAMAASGFLYLVAVYVGTVATTPPEHQQETGRLGQFLYDLSPEVGAVVTVATALLVYLTHRRFSE